MVTCLKWMDFVNIIPYEVKYYAPYYSETCTDLNECEPANLKMPV